MKYTGNFKDDKLNTIDLKKQVLDEYKYYAIEYMKKEQKELLKYMWTLNLQPDIFLKVLKKLKDEKKIIT